MDDIEVDLPQLGGGRVRRDLTVQRIPCFDTNHLALLDLHYWWDVGMPAVVACAGLLAQSLGTIDGDIGSGVNTHGRFHS